MIKEDTKQMKKVIVDFKKLTHTILDVLVSKYPDGYEDNDIITFRNHLNEVIECVEVRTNDTIYLIKVSKRLTAAMEDYDSEENIHDEYDKTELLDLMDS